MNTKQLVQDTLRSVFNDNTIVFDRSHFVGGMTNYNYKMNIHGTDYVVRQPGIMTEEIINRHIEGENNRIAAELGINSDCIFFDEKTGVKISRFINSHNVALDNPSSPAIVKEVSRLIKTLHTSGKTFPNTFDWQEELEKYEDVIKTLNGMLPSDYAFLRDSLSQFFDDNIKERILIPCHNDTVPENFLLDTDGRYYLIDWEYSGMNDPAWDVGAYIIESGLTEEAVKMLIDSYYGDNPTKTDFMHIKCFMMAQDLLWSTWALIRHYGGEDFLDYYMIRYSRFRRNLLALRQDPDFPLHAMAKPAV